MKDTTFAFLIGFLSGIVYALFLLLIWIFRWWGTGIGVIK
jgi:hypothetical protein